VINGVKVADDFIVLDELVLDVLALAAVPLLVVDDVNTRGIVGVVTAVVTVGTVINVVVLK